MRKKIHVPYDESKRVVDMLAVHEYDDIPQALPYFEVPFTEDGIMQAWLLDKITLFLPLFWHCLYNKKFFILNNDNIDWGFAESSKDEELKNVKNIITAMDREPLYPIIKIDGDEALLTLTYWNAWRGLVKECIKARRNGTCIVFDEKVERTILVPYESGIRF